MKQVLQHLSNGATEIVDVPCPVPRSSGLLVRSRTSLISAGTERMLLEFGKANPIQKARQQPDKVRMVLDKIRADGLLTTFDSVKAKLAGPIALGYSNCGVVLDTGADAGEFRPGDRVVSNGSHAEVVSALKNLCARIPDGVSDESAAFTVVGAIALQGIRLIEPTLGECFAVIGLGLIGLLTLQILRAHGCRVLGIDFDPVKLSLAASFGAEIVDLSRGDDPIGAGQSFSRGRGVDGVLIAAATRSNEPVHQAAEMCRKRGRIVLTGTAGLELSREDFYRKELSFKVSCSYGPGRYDSDYESGQDYPYPFVRWTAQRNFEAFLDLLASRHIDVAPLVSHRFSFDQAAKAYDVLVSGESCLGILLIYPHDYDASRTLRLAGPSAGTQEHAESPCVGLIGAGNYASAALLPALKKAGATLSLIAAANGLSAAHNGRRYGFRSATSDPSIIFEDAGTNTVFIATRHDSHARFVLQALRSGKHVFVEKPLCLTPEELAEIESEYRALRRPPLLMAGFNRRFAPQVVRIREMLTPIRAPKSMVMLVNAGYIPPDHWTQHREVGGGRIIGEACHFIDLLRFLANEPIAEVHAGHQKPDSATITLSFAEGSTGTVHYFTAGHKGFPKERLTVLAAGRVLELDNFRQLTGWGWRGFSRVKCWKQDKGHTACVKAFLDAVRTGAPSPIPFDEIVEVARITMQAARQ